MLGEHCDGVKDTNDYPAKASNKQQHHKIVIPP